MAYQLQECIGSIFPNDKWEQGGKMPKARGRCLINGVPHEIAVWPPKPGKKWSFFKISPERQRDEQRPAPRPNTGDGWPQDGPGEPW